MRLNIVCIVMLALSVGYHLHAQNSTINQNANIKPSTKMKEFSLLVRVPVTYTTEQAQAVGPQWEKVLEKWKSDGVYVISFAFPGESYVVSGADKSIAKGFVLSNNLRAVSNIVLRVATFEEATQLAKDCPILQFGGSVEIREIPEGVKVVNR